jgi:hypothetical protein
MACEGFIVIERLIKNGTPVVFEMPEKASAYQGQKMLMQHVCAVCPFYENDCDFILSMLSPPIDGAETKRPLPCGGFMLLSDLLDRKTLVIDDIRNII